VCMSATAGDKTKEKYSSSTVSTSVVPTSEYAAFAKYTEELRAKTRSVQCPVSSVDVVDSELVDLTPVQRVAAPVAATRVSSVVVPQRSVASISRVSDMGPPGPQALSRMARAVASMDLSGEKSEASEIPSPRTQWAAFLELRADVDELCHIAAVDGKMEAVTPDLPSRPASVGR